MALGRRGESYPPRQLLAKVLVRLSHGHFAENFGMAKRWQPHVIVQHEAIQQVFGVEGHCRGEWHPDEVAEEVASVRRLLDRLKELGGRHSAPRQLLRVPFSREMNTQPGLCGEQECG